MIRLVLRMGNNPRHHEFAGDTITIGRASTNHLVIGNPRVSRLHARIERFATGIRIVDLSSGNGTRLNGARIESEYLLAGDLLQIGPMPLSVVEVETSDPPRIPVTAPARRGRKTSFRQARTTSLRMRKSPRPAPSPVAT